jgi:hypothetical protein
LTSEMRRISKRRDQRADGAPRCLSPLAKPETKRPKQGSPSFPFGIAADFAMAPLPEGDSVGDRQPCCQLHGHGARNSRSMAPGFRIWAPETGLTERRRQGQARPEKQALVSPCSKHMHCSCRDGKNEVRSEIDNRSDWQQIEHLANILDAPSRHLSRTRPYRK